MSFIAYAIVGLTALVLELLALRAALVLGLNQPYAVSCGYVVSALYQFYALRYVVFRVAHKRMSIQAASFVVGQLALWALLVGAVQILTLLLPLSTMQARLICVPSLFPVNYLVSKYLIFPD